MTTKTKAYLALAIVCVFWGTTYLALRIGVQNFPPFLFTGIRQFAAGVLLLLWMAATKNLQKLTLRDIAKQALPGFLLITLGNGIIGWAEMYIPSGLAALIVCIMPVYIVLINLVLDKEKQLLNTKVISGFLLGCAGIFLIFRDNISDLAKPEYFFGVVASFAACLFWAIGSIYMKSNTFNSSAYSNAAIQFISGGIGCFIFSAVFDDFGRLAMINSDSLWALAYLIVIGSLLSYMSYLYAIRHLPMIVVSTYAYVNPVIAILLGVAVLAEKITWLTLAALVVTLLGVYMINAGFAKRNPIKSDS